MSTDPQVLEKISIDDVLKDRFLAFYDKVPRFVVKWLEKLLHIKELNAAIDAGNGKTGIDFAEFALNDCFHNTFTIIGEENLPTDGRNYTFVSNHPLGGMDGLAYCMMIGRRYGTVRAVANDFLMLFSPMRPLFAGGVNKIGAQSRCLSEQINDLFSYDGQVLMFPAGMCSRKIDGEIIDLEWRKTFVTKSIENKRDIVPMYFDGTNSKRFYRIANICKALKIKFNFAMVLLPDEMFKNAGKHFNIIIGKPIPWQSLDHSKRPAEWAQTIKDVVYELKPKKR